MAGSGDDVTINLTAVDNVSPVLRQVSQAMGAFSGDATRMVSSLAQLGAVALPIMAIGGAFIYAGQQAAMVQQNVANLNAVLHATSEQLAAIRNNGLALSQATQFTDAQILASQRQLAKGGATAADLAQGGSQGVTGATLNLAAATQSTPTAAATSMTTASSAFQIPIQDAAKTATILASAVDSSVGSLANQATALKQVGVVAKAAGFDVKETVTTIADLQNNGMLNDSGTGLKTFLSRIEAPSGAAKKQIDDLGLSFYDLQGKLKPVPELFDEIHTKMMGLDQQTANDALTKIFGLRGVRVADVALEQGSSGYIDTAQSMAEKGDAAEIAGRKLDTFQGSVSKAVSSLNVLAVQFGTALLPGMKSFADMTEHTANMLSGLNNNVAILPQIAVGIGAITGISKVGSFIGDRRDERQTAAQQDADAARAKVNAPIEAGRQAQVNSDLAISNAHMQAVEKMATADAEYTKKYQENIAKEIDSVNALMDAEMKRAEMAARTADLNDEKALAAQAIQQDFAHQRLDLQAVQSDKTGMVTGATSTQHTKLSERQALDTEEKMAIQESNASFLPQYNALAQERVDGEITAEKAAAARGQTELQAVYAEKRANIAKMEEESIGSSQATLGAKLFSVNGLGAGRGTGMIGSGEAEAIAASVPVKTTLTTGTVVAEEGMLAGLKAKAGTVVSTLAKGLGSFVMPVLIAATVVEMVIKPIEQAVIDKAVRNDPQLQDINASVDLITQGRGPGSADTLSYADQVTSQAQARQNIQDTINQKQAQLDEAKKAGGQLFGTAGGPTVPGAQGLNDLAAKAGFVSADVGALQKEIDSLNQSLKTVDAQGKQTELMPEAALSKANDTMTALLANIDNGTMSVDQFTVAWKEETAVMGGRTAELEKAGVSQQKAIALEQQAIDLAKQHQKVLDDAKQQAQADYVNNANDAVSFRALGASPDLADVAAFGQHTDQSAATKVDVAEARKEVAELKTAWTGAQTVINGIDISKGFDAFAKLADGIALANRELANVGQDNAALDDLGRYAEMFKQVTDAETAASAAMNGYNLTLDQSSTYMTKLGQVQKEVDTALQEAERRIAAGRGTAADSELVKNSPNINANLANQQDTISQHMVLDVLGTVHNLPDFASLDTYMRDIVEKGGGGINIAANITSNARAARQEIENILKPDLHVNLILDPVITQNDPALLASIAKYGAATQSGTYNDQGGPPLPPAGSSSGLNDTYGAYGPSGNDNRVVTSQAAPRTAVAGNPAGATLGDAAHYPTATPRGDAAALMPYSDLIEKASAAYGVPDWVIGAVIMHESGGTPGAVQPGRLGRGLMQVDLGQHPDQQAHESQLTGTSRSDVEYQIDAGTKIMADFFKQYGPGNENAAIQNYAGPAYQSKASGGVPSGLDLPTELTDYYKQQVIAVLTSGSGAGAGGQMGAATNAAFSVGTAVNAQVSKTDVEAQIEATTRQHLGDPKVLVDGVMKPAYGWCDAFVNNMIQQATGVNKRFANADQQIRAAIAGQPGAGTVIDQSQAKPGDLVGWKGDQREAGDPAGHIGIYSGGNKYIGTTSAGVQEKTLPANAIFIRPDGVVSNGPTPGSVLHVGNGTASGAPGTIDASQTPSQPQMPFVVQPTAAQMASQSAYGSQMSGMDARGQGEVDALLTKITPLFTNIAADRGINIGGVTQTFGANRTRDPNATEKQMIDNAGLADSYNVASKVGVAIEAINKGLAITPQMYKDIADAAGPVGGLIDAQVAATADLEQHTRTLANLKSVQAADDASHQLLTQQRQNDATDLSNQHTLKGYDEQKQQRDITAARLVTTRQEQDADTSRQRTQTLDQRAIDDKMTAQQRAWQDEQTRLADSARVAAESQRQQDMADQNHKQNLDDAYQIVQRQEQDQQRILNFRGGQDMITLQDAKKTLDDQHRIATEGMQQNEGLYVSLGKGSSTEAQATAYASQAAAIDDARKKADDLYAKQSEANTRAQDALTKYNAQVMFNLQTEQIAADRKHQDDLKNIDEAALKRHNDYNTQLYDLQVEAAVRAADHLVITRQEEDVAKARTRGIEDEQFAIAATRLAEQRRWQDDDVARQTSITLEQQGWAIDKMHADELARQQDQAYADRKTQNTNDQQAEQTSITNIGKVITGLDAAIARVNTIIQQYGVVAAQQSGLLNAPVNNAPGANGSQYTRNLGGFATGTAFSPGGDAQVNEQGGEMRTLLSGETIIPADQTKRMFDSLLSVRNNVSPISSAPSYHEGNITIQMGDSSLSLSAGAQAKIRAIVQDEIESQQPTTYTARQAATGGLKR